ncbi:MAG: Mrp/NBP35 family ATP-binding protein [Rhodospirillales bacterium]|nr:Mrp/NBP35 family ATP-binding protein [Rhodospirillales bacterium]
MANRDDIFQALHPLGITAETIEGLHIDEAGNVQFALQVDPARGAELEPLRQQAEQAVKNLKGVARVTAILTAERKPASAPPPPAAGADPHGMQKNPRLDDLPIKYIIAIASGKGGVGKSTIAVNLARAFRRKGLRTGLLDADIYGPSVPKLTRTEGQKPLTRNDKLIPLETDGLKIMSIGFMVDPAQAVIWRGPMAQTALYQMLRDVAWGTPKEPLDVLIIDMPPGTGDIQLTLSQKVPVSGAVIVSTPQDIALIDARKAVDMFQKTSVPILGLIENMSVYTCQNCGHTDHIFGQDGAKAEAQKLGVPFLGALPLQRDIRLKSDAGEAVTLEVFDDIAEKLIQNR